MNLREMNLAIFSGAPVPQVLFQPRIEPWYAWHRDFGEMPEAYRDLSLLDLFDRLGASIRYVHYYTDLPSPLIERYSPEVTIHERFTAQSCTRVYETPYGDLTEQLHRTPDNTWRTVDFAVRAPDDLRKLRWLYDHRETLFSGEYFDEGSRFMGERGEPQFWVARSPYQALALDWMRYQDFVYALADYPHEIENTFRAIDAAYDVLYEGIVACEQVRIVNFGENLHSHLISPRYFERYLLPFYTRRSGQLRAAGRFTHIHIDGALSGLLNYLADLPFDGIEALTPQPQGDVTLETIKEHIGDKVLLDGIPAVLFLPTFSREQLMQTVEEVVRLFHPRLVLGVSDEVPEGAGQEAMERVKLVADWCRAQSGA